MTSTPAATPADEPEVLTCPECSRTHVGTIARIGNRKTKCSVCNRFAQTVRRHVARALVAAHPVEAEHLRRAAERDAYGQIVTPAGNLRRRTPAVGSTDTTAGTP